MKEIYVKRFKNCATVGLCYQDTFMTSHSFIIKYLSPARQRLRCSVPNFDISLQIYSIYTQPIIDLGYFLSIASQTNKVKKTNKSMDALNNCKTGTQG